MSADFPYEKHRNSELCNIVQNALQNLVDNNDLMLCTDSEYVIGYLVKMITNDDPIETKNE